MPRPFFCVMERNIPICLTNFRDRKQNGSRNEPNQIRLCSRHDRSAAISAQGQQTAAPKSAFTVVNSPSGGQYIYGPLPGRGSMPDAVVYMLQQVHTYDRLSESERATELRRIRFVQQAPKPLQHEQATTGFNSRTTL